MTSQSLIDIEKITSAISADNPSGNSATYEDEFESIDLEIKKLSSIQQLDVDWGVVHDNCVSLLSRKTKDLTLTCYLTASLFEKQGYQGLAEGLNIQQLISTKFWASLYPEKKRMRGRSAAINWLNQRLTVATKRKKPTAKEHSQLEDVFKLVDELNQFYSHEITENTPSLLELSRQLNEYRSSLLSTANKQTKSKDTTAIENSSDKIETSKKSTVPGDINNTGADNDPVKLKTEDFSTSETSKIYRDIQQSIRPLVTDLRSQRLNNPHHFYLNRIASWISVTDIPVHEKNKTQLVAPAKEVIATLQSKIKSADYEAAITQIEVLLPQSPFWFDAQRLSVLAMKEMGRSYEGATKMVASQTKSFCQRFPDLLKMRFSDGTPFASEQFKNWIKKEADKNVALTTNNSSDQALDSKLVKKVAQLSENDKLDEAMVVLQQKISDSGSKKTRMSLRLLQAATCANNERHDLAYPLYLALDKEQQKHRLESWDPEVASQILLGLLNSLRDLTVSDSTQHSIDEQLIVERLCRLNIASIT